MPNVDFNGAAKYISLSEIGTYSIEDIYSQWKQWASQAVNAHWSKAFDTTGGDNVGGGQEIAPYFFCRNDTGWLVKMPPATGDVILSGNLFPRDPTQTMFIPYEGFDAFLRLEVSTKAVVITVPTSVGGGLTAEQDAKLSLIPSVKSNTNLIPALL